MSRRYWVIVPADKEKVSSALVLSLVSQAREKLNEYGTIIKGPWFGRYVDGPNILPNDKFVEGFGILYYADVEENDAPASTDTPTEGKT